MDYEIRNAVNQMFNNVFPSFVAKQIDSHLNTVKVPIKKKEKIKLLGFIPFSVMKKTGDYTEINVDKLELIRIASKKLQLSSEKYIYYGIDEMNKKIYWRYKL